MALVRMDKSILTTPQAVASAYSLPSYEGGEDENRGGLLGGVGYLGEKLAVGTVQSIEGISDFLIGGAAKLFGFDKFAERQFVNDWFGDWYSHPDEWFNPGDGWKVAGDIAGGIGTSLPTLVAGALTGGAGMFATAALSSAGNATKEAYMKTGKLGIKEFAYGALTGALEGSMEAITNKIGLGTSAILESFGISFAKNVSKSAISQGIGTFAKAFAGEAFEEGVAEIMSAPFKRLTYDKNAEFASADEILYAAFVGGMSGVVMNGVGVSFASARNISRGNQAVEAGQVEEIMERAKEHSKIADESGIEKGIIKQVSDTYKKLAASLEKTNGEVKTVAQKRMLGELKIGNVAALTAPRIYKAAATIASDPDTFVEKINAYGYTDANGKPITVTKEQLMEGIDVKDLKGSIPKALETNETLRNIVMMSAAGEIFMNVSKFQESVLRGETFAGDADLEYLLNHGKPEEIQAMQKLLGIGDLHNVDPTTFNRKVAELKASGKLDELYNKYKANKANIGSIPTINPEENSNLASESENINAENANIATESVNSNVDNVTATPDADSNMQNISQNVAKPLDNEVGVRYAKSSKSRRKFSFQHKNFPQENEVQSEAHRLAVWWSYNKARSIGDQTLISMNDRWYLVEKFDDATSGYRVEDRITKPEYKQIYEEIKKNGRSGKILSIQEEIDTDSELDQFGNSVERGTSSSDSMETEHGGENPKILQVDKGKSTGRKTERNGRRDSESSSKGSQRVTPDKNSKKALPSEESRRYVDRGPKALIQESPIKVVHTFKDVSGKTKHIIKIGSEYYIKDNHRAHPTKSIEQAIENENKRVIIRYAKKRDTSAGHIMRLLEDNPDFLIKERKKGVRFALSDTDSDTADTSDFVSKSETTERKTMTVAESAEFAKENVPEYKELNADDQARVRRLIRQAKANGFTDKQMRYYARVASRSGIDIVIDKESLRYTDKKGRTRYADGLYSPKRNKIFVNPEGSRSPARLLIHELAHAIYNDGKGGFITLERSAKDLPKEEKMRIVEEYFEDVEIEINEDGEIEISEDGEIKGNEKIKREYNDELNAHYIEALLDDDRLLEKLCNDNPTLPDKILSFFKKAITGYSDEPTLSREAKKLYKRYKTLFDSFSVRNQYGEVKGEGEKFAKSVKNNIYDYSKTFEEQIDDYKNGLIPQNDTLLVSGTPEVWKKVGFNALPVTINQTHIDYALNGTKDADHHIGEVLLKDLPNAIQNPVAIIQSQSPKHNDRAVVIFKMKHNGKNIIGAIEVDGQGITNSIRIASNAMTSLFAKTNVLNQLNNAINNTVNGKTELFYWNKNEAITLLQGAGHQLSSSLPQDGFVYSIRDNGSKVKRKFENVTETQQFKRWFGDWQKKPKKASKVVNNDGTPMIVYHGTNEDFNTFSYESIGRSSGVGILGEGFYFTQTSDLAKKYGKNVMSCYLQMKKPYIAKSDEVYKLNSSDLEKQGYDGVILKAPEGDIYMVFDNTQIKSATDNIGTFDKTNPDIRYALPRTDTDTADMSGSVGKKRTQYEASRIERLYTALDSAYIDTVDELYGATKFLSKVGKMKNAADIVQAIRASMSVAQAMIGDVQYDIMSDDAKLLGDGLSKIVKPVTLKGDSVKISFNEYLMHWLNIDRMSLEEKSLARLDEMKSKLEGDVKKLREVNAKIAELKAKKQSMFSDAEAQKQLDANLEKYEGMAKALKKDVRAQKKQIDNFEVMKNKPVFDKNDERENAVTAEESRKRIAELEKTHPYFKETAEKLWAYTKNLNHMRVESGLISADSEAYMNELYPHYVPAYRDTKGGGVAAIKGRRNLAISSTVRRAKGSGLDVLDAIDSIASQTQEVVRAGRINQLFRKMYDIASNGEGAEYVEIVSREKVSSEQVADDSTKTELTTIIEVRPKGNQITGFVNGEKVTLSVSDEIFIAFDSMGKPTIDPTSSILQGAKRLNELYKKLLTSYSPAFLIRNPIKDIQDAGLNSKHAILFAKNLTKAAKIMFENGEAWQIYRAYGGYSASIFGPEGFSANVDSRGFEAMAKLFDSDEVTIKTVYEAAKKGGKNILVGINNLNAFVEQATRFAEYLASIEAGDSIPTAINNAAEVTTNFGRRGRLTKKLNATIMPFLNPAIQGFDKIFRNVGDAFKAGNGVAVTKALGNLFTKAALIGLAPMLVNMLLYGDDDDYEKLRETDKENNFLIKVGDTFIKIPRGRLASVIGGSANRTSKLIKGEDADLKDYAENVMNQVTPVGNLTRTIFSPFFDVKNNRTWYGSEIEGRQWDNTAPKDRYDESTSSIAIAIGKVINYSPKKIHYLLDQYSGVIGDFVLPMTSKKAHKDFFSGNFTIDAATSNKLSSSFYKIYDKAQYAKTTGDDTAIYQVKYLNQVKDAISKLHDEKQAIQNNSELSNVEKLQQSRVVQVLINQAYETALADFERYTQAFEATEGLENTSLFKSAFGAEATEATVQKMRYTEATRYMYGAKKALEEYNEDVYAKCELLNLAGVDYDKLYYYYFVTKGLTSDVDKRGNVVSGSKKKKVIAEINKLGVTVDQKLLLIAAKGYSLSSAEKRRLLNYILKLKTTKEKRIELAELCGFEVKNGRIVTKIN